MKRYTCVLAFAIFSLQAWGADAARVPYHVETVAGSSRIGDGGPALAVQFSNIQGIAIDRLGNLYLSDTDHHRVRKVSGGTVTMVAGTGVAGFSGDGGSALDAQLNFAYGLALDSAGNVYVADLGNQRVRRIPTASSAPLRAPARRRRRPTGPLPPTLRCSRHATSPWMPRATCSSPGLKLESQVMVDKVIAIQGNKITGRVGVLAAGPLKEIDNALRLWLELA
jgi:mRNA-degrading endonuclease toxin of MazEF toxin-antitoxin module